MARAGSCGSLIRMDPIDETAYIVFDTESVADGALMSRVLYPGDGLAPEEAIARYTQEQLESRPGSKVFIPVSFHVPVAIAIARVNRDYHLIDVKALDAPRFDSRSMVDLFWKGLQAYKGAVLVDFNGRGFDLPLMTMSAFRFGLSCPRYFNDEDRFGFRYRFTDKHLDLMEWMTEYGSYRLTGGLDLLAKMLGKPGKMETKGNQVQEMHSQGKLQEINDYCVHDVLDTYFVMLRTRVLSGKISLEREQELVEKARGWLEDKATELPAISTYVAEFGKWSPDLF